MGSLEGLDKKHINGIDFRVVNQDVIAVDSDLLLLKYTQTHLGAAKAVFDTLVKKGKFKPSRLMPKPGDHVILDTSGKGVAAKLVMFFGASPLTDFSYSIISSFARTAVRALLKEGLHIDHLATTIHGVMFGLDAGEALRNLIQGFCDIKREVGFPREVTIVEINPNRYKTLLIVLNETHLELTDSFRPEEMNSNSGSEDLQKKLMEVRAQKTIETRPKGKEHVFVAMPFSDEFEDVFEFGIYAPVTKSGFICEHVGQAAFTGDVLQRIRDRIGKAKLVIADLSGARPNVYLEVGYAWGCGVPVVILARQGEELHFDVKTHRCIYYRNIKHLARELEGLIQKL